MPRVLVDVRDEEALSSALSQVFLFIEHINGRASQEVRKLLEEKLRARGRTDSELSGRERSEELLRSVARPNIDFKNIIRQVFQWLVSGEGRWSDQILLLELLRQEGIQPAINPRILQLVAELLLHPARIVPKNHSWKIEGWPKVLPRASGVDLLTEKLWVYEGEHAPLLATRPLLAQTPLFSHRLHVYSWEEPFDAMGITRLFLAEVLGEAGRSADHYLQRWLRTTFNFAYEKSSKYTLAVVCDLFNQVFYGNPKPTTQTVHNQRTPTVSFSLLVNELTKVLQVSSGTSEGSSRPLKNALGLYFFLSFCRQLRRRFFWVDLESACERQIPEDSLRYLADLSGESCVSALRPLGYTYFQSRIFGFISTTPGLSNVFRGGLLSRTDYGCAVTLLGPAGIGKTVMALQWMADFARFGGLAIYLSFEETFDSILDRLVTFGLIDTQKFQVRSAGGDLVEVLKEAFLQDAEKGLLIFYRASGGTLFEIIQEIAEATKDWPRSRPKALVVDSVNALQFMFTPGAQPLDVRRYLQEVVSQIVSSNFFGLVLGEREGDYYQILPYLADTVLEMGFDENAHTRWFEIRKCRIQDYHEGKHPLRIQDGRGVIVYPSLASRRSSLRGRIRSTPSQWRVIPYPYAQYSKFRGLPEKSSTLIWGPVASGKTLVALRFLAEPSTLRPRETKDSHIEKELPENEAWSPQNVMVITFRTSEKNFLQTLQRDPGLAARWAKIPLRWLRWYSPGSNLSAEQIVSEIWRYFKESRRKGVPVDRVLFDETEVAEDVLTALRRDPLFWPTILELISTEAATSFFVCGSALDASPIMKILRGSMDNELCVQQKSEEERVFRYIEVQQHPESDSASRKSLIEPVA
jgi:KaiC/GvpD/RAD55 family RecA-like ATPase